MIFNKGLGAEMVSNISPRSFHMILKALECECLVTTTEFFIIAGTCKTRLQYHSNGHQVSDTFSLALLYLYVCSFNVWKKYKDAA